MPRNVNTLTKAFWDDPNIVCFEFAKLDFASPTGTLFWTEWSGNANSIIVNLDGGGDQEWDSSKVWIPGQFEQGDQSALAISDVSFGNADYYFSDIMKQHTYGVRGVALTVWLGGFQNVEPFAFVDRILLYQGVMDRAEVQPDFVRVSMLPGRAPLTSKVPRRRYTLSFGFKWIPKANLTIQFGSAGGITLPNPSRPAAGSPGATQPPGGGGGTPPPIGFNPTARGPIVRVGRPRAPTRTTTRGGPGGPRDPRTVTR